MHWKYISFQILSILLLELYSLPIYYFSERGANDESSVGRETKYASYMHTRYDMILFLSHLVFYPMHGYIGYP